MHLRVILSASLLVLCSFTVACVGGEQADGDDEAQAAAQTVEVSVETGTIAAKDTKTTTTTTTTTTKDPCVDSKVKTACKQQTQVTDYLHQ
jgi:hypothetical protein